MILRFVLISWLVWAGAFNARADAPDVAVSWQPARPDIGDIVMLTVEITVSENLLVTFPRLDEDMAGFAVTGRLPSEPERAVVGSRLWRQVYRLELEGTGDIALPDISVTVHDPETLAEITAVATGLTIPVAARAAHVTDLRSITGARGTVGISVARRDNTVLIAGLLSASLIVVLLIGWRLRRKPGIAPITIDPPRLTALRALERLDPDSGAQFHTDLAQVLRTYLDRALGVGAPRQTTGEAVAALRVRDLDASLLQQALSQCDRVKFARAEPGREDRDRVRSAAIAFVSATGAG